MVCHALVSNLRQTGLAGRKLLECLASSRVLQWVQRREPNDVPHLHCHTHGMAPSVNCRSQLPRHEQAGEAPHNTYRVPSTERVYNGPRN
jgi:hypothetical protein